MPALAPALANRQLKTRQSTHEPGALNPEWNESWHLGEAAADVGETPQFVPMQKPERADSGRRWRLHCRPNGSLAMGFAGRTRRLPRTKCMRVVTFAEVAAFGGKGKSAERPCARSLVVRSGRADGAVETATSPQTGSAMRVRQALRSSSRVSRLRLAFGSGERWVSTPSSAAARAGHQTTTDRYRSSQLRPSGVWITFLSINVIMLPATDGAAWTPSDDRGGAEL